MRRTWSWTACSWPPRRSAPGARCFMSAATCGSQRRGWTPQLPNATRRRLDRGPGRDRRGAAALPGRGGVRARQPDQRRPAVPRFTPPRVFERGVDGRPTLVQNVETLAHLALIARYGPGLVPRAGHAGRARQHAVHAAPGRTARPTWPRPRSARRWHAARPLRGTGAVLVGGYHGAWLPAADAARLTLSNAAASPGGAFTGAGVLVALPADRCGLVETARVARYLALESAGQCGPCLNGLPRSPPPWPSWPGARPDPPRAHRPEPLGRAGRGARRLPPPRRDGPVRAQRAARVPARRSGSTSRAAAPPRPARARSCRCPRTLALDADDWS